MLSLMIIPFVNNYNLLTELEVCTSEISDWHFPVQKQSSGISQVQAE